MKRIGFVAFLSVLFLLFAGRAHALDCNSAVVDETGKVGDLSAVKAAANELTKAGADVRIRVIPTISAFGNVDRWFSAMWKQCPSMQNTHGGIKGNIIGVVISTDDRKMGVYYGSDYKNALDPQRVRIQTQVMGPNFRKSNWAAGLVGGMTDIQSVISSSQAAPPPRAVQRNEPPPAPVIINNNAPPQKPADLSGLWTVMKFGLGLFALGALAFLISQISRSRSRRRAAQQEALASANACASRIIEADKTQLTVLESKIGTLEKTNDPDETKGLRSTLASLRSDMERASTSYADLQQSSDPSKPGLSEEEYAVMQRAYDKLLRKFDDLATERSELEGDIKRLGGQADASAKAIGALGDRIKEVAGEIASQQTGGFKTGPVDAILKQAADAFEQAKTEAGAKRFGKALGRCQEGTKLADQASRDAAALPTRKAAITQRAEQLRARVASVTGTVAAGKTAIELMTTTYGAAQMDSVSNNPAQAEQCVAEATQKIDLAMNAASMDKQEWQQADSLLGLADDVLNRAELLISAITALSRKLSAPRRSTRSSSGGYGRSSSRSGGYGGGNGGGGTNVIVQQSGGSGMDPLVAGVLGYEFGRSAGRDDERYREERSRDEDSGTRGRSRDDDDGPSGGSMDIGRDDGPSDDEPSGGSMDIGSDDSSSDSDSSGGSSDFGGGGGDD